VKGNGGTRSGREPHPPRRIDWEEIHRNMDASRVAVESTAVPSRETTKAVLKERARVLAARDEVESDEKGLFDVLLFVRSSETYGVESKYLREVHSLVDLTPIPGVPRFILGVVSLRGRIVSVVDLGKLFELPEQGLAEQDQVTVIADKAMEIGLLANSIIGTVTIKRDTLQTSFVMLTGIRREFLIGVTADQKIILDGARLLSEKTMIIRDEV